MPRQALSEAGLGSLTETLETQVVDRTAERDRLWELSDDLLVVADFEGNLLRVSPSWTRLLGHNEATLLRTSFVELFHPDDIATMLATLATMRESGQPSRSENRVLATDGSWRWIAWRLSPEPACERLTGVGRDVTAEKERTEALHQAEDALRQSQKMDAVGQLTGGIAHDFNNLLQGIAGSLELLQSRIAQGRTAEVGRFLTIALTEVQRAAVLTHRLLAFSRRQPLDPKPLDANRLVAGMEELIRRTVGPGIEVVVVLSGGLWTTSCDANQLENALLNLAINARDAMPDGGRLTIETGNTHLDDAYARSQGDGLKPGQYVSICVTDNGVGMPGHVAKRAFEPFFTTKPIGQGTGLGLPMLYGFVKQSSGHARIYTEQGRGTTVRLYLPRDRGHEAELSAGADQEISERAGLSETVLVVEDEAAIRMLVGETLHDLGYHVLEAQDGPAALRLLHAAAQVDLMVTDVGLPGMNGRQLAEAARERRPDLKILFITGYAHNAAIGQGEALKPGTALISKPFALAAVAAKVRTLIAC